MDYILLSAVLGITAMYLAISYDITCQWRIHFEARMAAMPERMRLDLTETKVVYGLPVWHAAAHEKKCQAQNSLSYLPGVGRTDGEGIERTWSKLNLLAWATKEMNVGARHDTIEDKIDHHNFEKNVNQGTRHLSTLDAPLTTKIGTTLPCKLVLVLDERDTHVAAFTLVDSTLESELRTQWQTMIDEWIVDPTKPNPYMLEDESKGESFARGRSRWLNTLTAGPTEAQIRLALKKDEVQEAATGGGKLHGSSVTSFLTAGLQLEQSQ
jgi:hypothetical protein